MRNITTIQEALVDARMTARRSEAAAVRATRDRDHLRQHVAAGTEVDDHSADRPPRRVRIGRWLVAFGETVAGSNRSATVQPRAMAGASGEKNDPCGDGADRMAHAA